MHIQSIGVAIDLGTWLDDRTQAERAVIARLWSLPSHLAASPGALADAMLNPEALRAVLATLATRERAALQLLQAHDGVVPAAVLEREFGTVRSADNYHNPRAYLLALSAPPSPTERLYLFGLVQLFGNGANRSYAIPPDVLALLPPVARAQSRLEVSPTLPPPEEAASDSREFEQNLLVLLRLAQEGALETIPSGGVNKASLLRLAREWSPGEKLDGVTREEQMPYVQFLRCVAEGAELVHVAADGFLRPTHAALEWMRLQHIERMRRLLDGWVASRFDELASFNGMAFRRAYDRDVPRARRALLRLIAQLPAGEWIGFADFVAAVKVVEPDYARPNGVYDTWGIVNYLRQPLDGFSFWDEVEGEQILGVVGGALGWLGLVDHGMDGEEPVSFRMNQLGAALLQDTPAPDEPAPVPLVIQPNFEVIVPPFASLYDHFQIGRLAEPIKRGEVATFKLTRRALQAALERGTAFEDVTRFLVEASGRELPQNVMATLGEWAGQHGQVVLRRSVVLKTEDAALMARLRHDKRLRFPQTERLTETACVVREGDAAQLAERLRKAGYGLAGDDMRADGPLSEHDLTVVVAALEFYANAGAALGVEHGASTTLRRRLAKLLPEKQLNRAFRLASEATQRLKAALGR